MVDEEEEQEQDGDELVAIPSSGQSKLNETTEADYDEDYSTSILSPSSIIDDIEDIGETCMSLRMENKHLKGELSNMKAKVERLETAITRVFEDVVQND